MTTEMKWLCLKLGASILLMPILIGLTLLMETGVFLILLIFISIPLALLYCIDIAKEIQKTHHARLGFSFVGTLARLPQICLGLSSIFIGLAITLWILYNLLVERLPEYNAGFFRSIFAIVGVSPAFVLVGLYWLRGKNPVRHISRRTNRNHARRARRYRRRKHRHHRRIYRGR